MWCNGMQTTNNVLQECDIKASQKKNENSPNNSDTFFSYCGIYKEWSKKKQIQA